MARVKRADMVTVTKPGREEGKAMQQTVTPNMLQSYLERGWSIAKDVPEPVEAKPKKKKEVANVDAD
jgi:hypothetical protein